MSSFLHDQRQISFETDRQVKHLIVQTIRASAPDDRRVVARAVEVYTDWILVSLCSDGVLVDSSGVRKLDRAECLELAAWLTEAARLVPAREPQRRRGRPPGSKSTKMRPPEPTLGPPDPPDGDGPDRKPAA